MGEKREKRHSKAEKSPESAVRCPNCRGRLRRMFGEYVCEECEFYQKKIKRVEHTYGYSDLDYFMLKIF